MENNWISVEERIPEPFERDGSRFVKCVLVLIEHTNDKGKKWFTKEIATYFPQFFKECQWEDLDEEDENELAEMHLENNEERQMIFLGEGWWYEYEHRGDLYEKHIDNVVGWQPLPESPKATSQP